MRQAQEDADLETAGGAGCSTASGNLAHLERTRRAHPQRSYAEAQDSDDETGNEDPNYSSPGTPVPSSDSAEGEDDDE